MSNIGKHLIGLEFKTNNSGICKIISYRNCRDVTVRFENPFYEFKCQMVSIRNGSVDNPYYPRIAGVGYVGEGTYTSKKDKRFYHIWSKLLQRCYDERFRYKQESYKDVEVCKEWHNFQNFAKWCYDQKYSQSLDNVGRSYQLDKDIFSHDVKIYSPDTCCFIPSEVNAFFIKHKSDSLPMGVSFHKRDCKYRARVNCGGVRKNLGDFDKPEDAFKIYKKAKESYAKELAEKWKGRIDDKVYEVLMKYEVNYN